MSSDVLLYLQAVNACNVHYGWQLSTATQWSYATNLKPHLQQSEQEQWPMIIANYHADHRLVAALGNRHDAHHYETWQEWSKNVLIRMQRSSGLWVHDPAIDLNDLAQLVSNDLFFALGSYHYQSRFATWAYSVVAYRSQAWQRYYQAKRRHVPAVPIDLDDEHIHTSAAADPYTSTAANLLLEQIIAILEQQSDKRLARLFVLSIIEGRSSATIGTMVNLHESRVRALVQQARRLLQSNPHIQAWHAAEEQK